MNVTHRMIPQTRVTEIEFNRDDVLKAIKKYQIDNLAEIAGWFDCRTNEEQAHVFYNLLTNNQIWFDNVIESTGVQWIDTPKTDDDIASTIEEFPMIFFTNDIDSTPNLNDLPKFPSQLIVKYYTLVLDSEKILRNLGLL